MDMSVRVVSTNLTQVWFVSIFTSFILWTLPFIFGKYADTTFPYIAMNDITQELVGYVGPTENELHWCPVISPYIQGTIQLLNNNVESLSDEQIVKKYDVQVGGVWKPRNCQSRYTVAVIIPYRNRSQHLQQFLTYMHPFLMRQQLNYRIVVVEQTGDIAFNRAKLLNIGFVETLKVDHQVDCFIFHDVDLLPQNDYNIYACTHNPRHMYSAVDTFRYHLPYRYMFGGAVAILQVHFKKANGFSNKFYGWGGEDDDMYGRIQQMGLTVVRFDPRVATYVMLSHSSLSPSKNRYLILEENRDGSEDGLSNLSYHIVDKSTRPLYTWILVSC